MAIYGYIHTQYREVSFQYLWKIDIWHSNTKNIFAFDFLNQHPQIDRIYKKNQNQYTGNCLYYVSWRIVPYVVAICVLTYCA